MELLEIEKELNAEGNAAMVRYDEKLLALQARLEAALRTGLPPDEFSRCEALQEAITIARKLLRLQTRSSQSPYTS